MECVSVCGTWQHRYYGCTLSIPFRMLVISAQLPHGATAVVLDIQWTGGRGSTFGDGGSLNLAPAYAKFAGAPTGSFSGDFLRWDGEWRDCGERRNCGGPRTLSIKCLPSRVA